MESKPGNPLDGLTITESTDGFEAEGYDAQFAAIEGGLVRCFSCHTDSPAAAFRIDSLDRMEGPSDPSDMVAVVAAHCPHCNIKGTLVLQYGPQAGIEEQQVLKMLEDGRDSSSRKHPY